MDRRQGNPALLSALLLLLLSATHVLAHPITTTWTETETHTYTSTFTPTKDGGEAQPTSIDKSKPCVPQEEGQTACGWVCCAYYQECVEDGQCRLKPGFEEPSGTPIVITTDGQVTTLFSAPFRVTSGAAESTGGAGGGAGGSEDSEDDDSGLSGGAIAGIVVGSLAGVALLGMLCFCCIARGIFGALFGGRKKSGEDHDDRYTRRGSRPPSSYYSKRGTHSSWYMSGSSARDAEKRRSGDGSGGGRKWLGLGAIAATLLALLNIKRDKKPPRRTPTMYSDSYMYTDSTVPSTSLSPLSKNRHLSTSPSFLSGLGKRLTRFEKKQAVRLRAGDRRMRVATRGARRRGLTAPARTTRSAHGDQSQEAAGEARRTNTPPSTNAFSRPPAFSALCAS